MCRRRSKEHVQCSTYVQIQSELIRTKAMCVQVSEAGLGGFYFRSTLGHPLTRTREVEGKGGGKRRMGGKSSSRRIVIWLVLAGCTAGRFGACLVGERPHDSVGACVVDRRLAARRRAGEGRGVKGAQSR